MTDNSTHTVADVLLNTGEPTEVDRSQLFQWVLWQFPRPLHDGLCAAVRPPLPDHGWYPAIIHLKNDNVQVYAHLDVEFDSPETAVEYFSPKSPSHWE